MKFVLTALLFHIFCVCKAQEFAIKDGIQKFENCKNKNCKIKYSFLNAEYYLETDNLDASQKWLEISKYYNTYKKSDTTSIFINSLQAELFYYNGLFQFGLNESEKVIKNSIKLKDSLLISNGYFFKGINLFELNRFHESEKMLWKSKNYQPKNNVKKYLRSAILNEHIFNNLAQVKQKLQEKDSAIWYNSKAYVFAKKNTSKRGIPNIEQLYGLIYLDDNNPIKAAFYLEKSIESAIKNNYYDIELINYGYLMLCYPNNSVASQKYFTKGIKLIKEKRINISYQVIFFKTVVEVFKNSTKFNELVLAQNQLIKINAVIAINSNNYIQTISQQYVKNENTLLKQELNLTKSKKEKQIYYVLVLVLILILIGIWYFFKQRQKLKNQEIETLKQNQEITNLEALIDGEENERKRIAQELHDGLNGDLSAIKYRLSTLEDSGLSTIDTENLTKVITMIDESCAQVRSISHNLMPASILEYGLVESVREYCIKINNSNSFKIDFQTFGTYLSLSKKTETVIYRIIQELVTNILKHSKATEALIQINHREEELFITVEDNGIGFDTTKISDGIGRKNIKTRVDFLSAQLDVDSSTKGTSYTISIDLNKIK